MPETLDGERKANGRGGLRLEDGRVGRMAYFAGWLTAEQIARCLTVQKEARAKGGPEPKLGDVAVAEGFLTQQQVAALLRIQAINRPSRYDEVFGAIAVRNRYLTQDRLDESLALQKHLLQEHRVAPLLGIILAEKGLLSSDQVRAILQEQARCGEGPLKDLDAQVHAQATPAVAAEPAPAAEPAVEKALPRVICRCGQCGHTEGRPAWHAGDTCGQCGSGTFAPIPILDEAVGYSIADRSKGPAIEDGRLGWMAYLAGWMSQDQVQTCLRRQRGTADRGEPVPKFGEAAVADGFLSNDQVSALLRIQVIHRPADSERTFGGIALRAGYVTREQLDDCLEHQAGLLQRDQESPLLGIIMMERGLLNGRQVKAILELQARYGGGPLTALTAQPRRAAAALERMDLGSRRLWMAVAGAALLVFSIVAIASGWFGWTGWHAPDTVVGCRACGAVSTVPVLYRGACPECGAYDTLVPLVRCTKCGTVYPYGARGVGLHCPKCGSVDYEPVKNAADVPAGVMKNLKPAPIRGKARAAPKKKP